MQPLTDRTEIFAALTPVFHEVFGNYEITLFEEMTAADVAEWDSLFHIRLIVSIEEQLGIRFTTSEVHSPRNVGEFVDIILEKR